MFRSSSYNEIVNSAIVNLNSDYRLRERRIGSRRKCNGFPVMGKSQLLSKHMKSVKNDSEIVAKLVMEKFRNIVNHCQYKASTRSSRRIFNEEYKSIMEEIIPENMEDNVDESGAKTKLSPVWRTGNTLQSQIIYEEEEDQYDAQKFLEVALGDELYNYPSSLSDQTEVLKPETAVDDDFSIGTSNISTLLSKSNSSYNCFSKDICRLNMQSSTVHEEVEYLELPDDTKSLDCKASFLINEAAIQHQVIIQTSKALNLCLSLKEFQSSPEYIEAEKILLLANHKREAVLKCLRSVEYEECVNDLIGLGEVEISHLTFVTDDTDEFSEDSRCFLVIASCATKVLASDVVETKDAREVRFGKTLTFNELDADFEIIFRLYSLCVKDITKSYNHESKFHIKTETTMCPIPDFSLGCSNKKYKKRYSYERRQTSFELLGSTVIHISDMNRSSFKLFRTPSRVTSNESLNMKFSTSFNITSNFSGFLTIASDTGRSLSWNRRWCLLNGFKLKCWNYPNEQEFAEPISSIDLRYCVTATIAKVNRNVCARPRTLLLETEERTSDEDSSKSVKTITKQYLSADTVAEMDAWEYRLNRVLSALRNWNCVKFQPFNN